ncbi:hypothetical protein KJ671_01315 [Patescibacteria group bacterium]|nr:hypothetical protein [Patescibacteria group bacterium]
MKTPEFKKPKKELSPEEHAIIIERSVIEYHSLMANQDKSLSLEDIRKDWIKKYASKFRDLFVNRQNELIELYKENEQEAMEYIRSEIEKEEN